MASARHAKEIDLLAGGTIFKHADLVVHFLEEGEIVVVRIVMSHGQLALELRDDHWDDGVRWFREPFRREDRCPCVDLQQSQASSDQVCRWSQGTECSSAQLTSSNTRAAALPMTSCAGCANLTWHRNLLQPRRAIACGRSHRRGPVLRHDVPAVVQQQVGARHPYISSAGSAVRCRSSETCRSYETPGTHPRRSRSDRAARYAR